MTLRLGSTFSCRGRRGHRFYRDLASRFEFVIVPIDDTDDEGENFRYHVEALRQYGLRMGYCAQMRPGACPRETGLALATNLLLCSPEAHDLPLFLEADFEAERRRANQLRFNRASVWRNSLLDIARSICTLAGHPTGIRASAHQRQNLLDFDREFDQLPLWSTNTACPYEIGCRWQHQSNRNVDETTCLTSQNVMTLTPCYSASAQKARQRIDVLAIFEPARIWAPRQ